MKRVISQIGLPWYVSFVIFSLISGCGSPSYMINSQAFEKQGDCDSAVSEYENSDMWMGDRAWYIGVIYARCANDRENAIKWLTLSARYNNQSARDILVRLGAPVPSNDLYGHQ